MSDDTSTRTPEEIRAEIDQTREELGDTAEALGAKTDVKGQARERIESVKANLQSSTPGSAQDVAAKVRANPAPVALAGAILVGFLVGRRTSR